ncbi:MAG TPA: DinB family protein [Ohtaekwangia sp.]|nr:DinB family protein [Ohtaekwangia sp.]
MSDITYGQEFLSEMEAEERATRKCLERIPEALFSWKPHDKSMPLGTLSLLVAEIPKWISVICEGPEIDLATFGHIDPKTTAELVRHFEDNMALARNSLQKLRNESLGEPFYLKTNGQVVFTSPKKEIIGSSINHMVHHRGQLTVYMRLNDIPVPSIYGPSADDRVF